ncbi:hypothetical protein LHFGNBLO_006014 (plasmid) [Mesorhizobium sp. AR10]|uniref:hypothetical protein n=1 Tax=Mesorhizobium sp. AR10 TaxID=2865839 RepID=UPI00215ECEFD|nr:hypothetical protein [Mesorhizobium sp. AR10]UVK35800.1 hypothetical protein LHFGNBLO_006014 [Mesorhizobium sp. AR10]
MPTDQQYGASIRNETTLFANWPPNAPREIGDFGRVNGALFEFFGHLNPEEIEMLGSRESPSPVGYDIMIKSTRSLNAHLSAEAKAKVADGKALLEIKFTSEKGVVFAAPSVTITEIASLQALGHMLNKRRLEGNWDTDHAVVVQVSKADSATILLSNQEGAGIDFEVAANAPVNAQLVAKLDAGASVVDSRGVGIKIIGEGPLTPLFKLAYLKRRIFGDPKIVYREALAPNSPNDPEIHEVDDEYVLAVL